MRSRVFGKDLPLKHMKTMATGSESRVRLGIAEPEQDGVVGFDEPCEDDAVFPTKAEATIADRRPGTRAEKPRARHTHRNLSNGKST